MGRVARSVSIACVLAAGGVARADGVSALLSPGVSASRTSHTDQAGRTTDESITDFTQQYRLSLDERPYPNAGFSGTGVFTKDMVWTTPPSGPTARTDTTAEALSTRLSLGTSLLGGSLSYDRRQDLVSGVGGRGWAIGNTYAATASWHPLELPTIDLRLSRADAHDPTAASVDTVAYDGLLGIGYTAVRGLDLRYSLRLSDVIQPGAETRSVAQDARASYRTTALGGRTTAYGAAGLSSIWSDTASTSPAGTVPTQRFPVAGLSLVEDFPALPETDVLAANPGLVNGDLRTPAAVDLGTSVGGADRRPRDLGAQLADVVTKVNRIQVWVDRPLPPAVASAFLWDAYSSDDGQHWTAVALAGSPTFAALENRFEIPIVETAARYLKVVTHALDPSVSTDPRYADVWVTELQLFDAVPAAQLRRDASKVVETFSGSAQTRLLAAGNLSHDVSVSLTHPTDGGPTTWLLVNGLSATQRTTRTLTLSGRVAEQESDAGSGRTSSLQWSASASHQPLPTLGEGLTYSGQLTHPAGRTDLSNSLGAYARAQLYTGVSATANASASLTSSSTGASSRATGATIGASIVPNRVVTLATTYGFSTADTSTPGQPSSSSTRQRADATASFTPFPALYASAGVTRSFGTGRPATLGHLALNLSPFPDGQVLFRVSYTDAFDSSLDARTQTFTPTLRWTVAPRAYLDLAYSDIRTASPVESSRIQTASANFTLSL